MHSLYFVLLGKDIENSEDARDIARNTLDEQGFAGENGFFGSSKADWYVIGGRWSGELSKIQLKKDFFKEADLLVKPKHDFGMSSDEIEKNKDGLQALWEKMGGVGINPYNRNSYDHQGAKDDAQKLTPALIKAVKKTYKHKKGDNGVEMFDAESFDELRADSLSLEDVGKWLVVIDYHM